ncbi:MAG: hypothetical protein JW996_04065 [Candidatus Cloacimonetes bacterium]|nr:hypothetical protein [Candidatus Cloacimonadota bacterium]
MYRYLTLIILVIIFIFACDDRSPNEPDYTYSEIFNFDFSDQDIWQLIPDFSPAFGDTAWVLIDDDQLKMGALYGWDVPRATALYTLPDSLSLLTVGKNMLLELTIINTNVSEVGSCNLKLNFQNAFHDLSFSTYDLFDYSNFTISLNYDYEHSLLEILVNGVGGNSLFFEEPGILQDISLDCWTSSPDGSGSVFMNISNIKLSTYILEE